MNETKATQILKWVIVGITILVGLVTLVMSWYSMMDLATTTFHAPSWLAAFVSLAFDGGAIALLLITVVNALKGESSVLVEMFGYLFIAGSCYINVTHADVTGMGLPGMIMFGAAPIILAIVFKFFVHNATRDYRRREGLLKERIPNAGLLAWVFKTSAAWSLFNKSLDNRINKAATQLKYVAPVTKEDATDNRDMLHVATSVGVTPDATRNVTKSVTSKPVTKALPATASVTKPEDVALVTKQPMGFVAPNVTLPEWLPVTKMSDATFATLCVTNGVTDSGHATKLRALQTGTEVKPGSIRTAMSRAKPKGE